jgi:hypothetical protein
MRYYGGLQVLSKECGAEEEVEFSHKQVAGTHIAASMTKDAIIVMETLQVQELPVN